MRETCPRAGCESRTSSSMRAWKKRAVGATRRERRAKADPRIRRRQTLSSTALPRRLYQARAPKRRWTQTRGRPRDYRLGPSATPISSGRELELVANDDVRTRGAVECIAQSGANERLVEPWRKPHHH